MPVGDQSDRHKGDPVKAIDQVFEDFIYKGDLKQ